MYMYICIRIFEFTNVMNLKDLSLKFMSFMMMRQCVHTDLQNEYMGVFRKIMSAYESSGYRGIETDVTLVQIMNAYMQSMGRSEINDNLFCLMHTMITNYQHAQKKSMDERTCRNNN